MTAITWIGLDGSGEVDTTLASEFGATISEQPSDENNIRFKQCLAVACDQWERITGRAYARTQTETRTFSTQKNRLWLRTPSFQSLAQVERLMADGSKQIVEADTYEANKLGAGRGTYDAIYKQPPWQCGHYFVEAIWGELEPPEQAKYGAMKYATYLFKVQTNPSGVGTFSNLESEIVIEYEKIPGVVYGLMQNDRVAGKVFSGNL